MQKRSNNGIIKFDPVYLFKYLNGGGSCFCVCLCVLRVGYHICLPIYKIHCTLLIYNITNRYCCLNNEHFSLCTVHFYLLLTCAFMSHMQAGVMFSFRKSSQNIFLSISRGNTACSYKSISLCVFRQHL